MEGNANDELGSHNGSLSGTYNFGLSYGKILQGFNTTGASGYAEIGSTSDFTFIQNTGEFTISLWMKLADYTIANRYPVGNTGTSSQKGFWLGNNGGTGRLSVVRGDGIASSLINASYTNLFTDNNWHHIVATASDAANQVYFYKDGVQLTPTSGATVGTLSSGNSTNPTRFGYSAAGAWIGDMDELGFWSRALAPSEVLELYNGGAGLTYPFTASDTSKFFVMF